MAATDRLGENTRHKYYSSVRDIAKDIISEQKRDPSLDESDQIWESVDGSYWVIYTHAAFATLWFSDNWLAVNDAIEEGLVTELESIEQFMTQAAFFALKADVEEAIEELRRG